MSQRDMKKMETIPSDNPTPYRWPIYKNIVNFVEIFVKNFEKTIFDLKARGRSPTAYALTYMFLDFSSKEGNQ